MMGDEIVAKFYLELSEMFGDRVKTAREVELFEAVKVLRRACRHAADGIEQGSIQDVLELALSMTKGLDNETPQDQTPR